MKDRMPEKKEHDTLVTDGTFVKGCPYLRWYGRSDKKPWDWLLPYQIKSVTHWMPLPAPPEIPVDLPERSK